MAGMTPHETVGFSLGTPALVCRWRLAAGRLLLENRHMRALARRAVGGVAISPELVAWAKQHVEWTLAEGSHEHPDGVLMLIVDENGAAAMTVGPYEPLAETNERVLLARAQRAAYEQDGTGIAPETIFAYVDGELMAGIAANVDKSAASSLVVQLAQTLGIATTYRPDLAALLAEGAIEADETFLASDEHGIVVSSDRMGERAARFAASYQRLFDNAHKKR